MFDRSVQEVVEMKGFESVKYKQRVGGDEGIRTLDPYVANVVLSQLSYIPTDIISAFSACNSIPSLSKVLSCF